MVEKKDKEKRLGPASGMNPPDVDKRNKQEEIGLKKTLLCLDIQQKSTKKQIERDIKIHLCKHGHLLPRRVALQYGYEPNIKKKPAITKISLRQNFEEINQRKSAVVEWTDTPCRTVCGYRVYPLSHPPPIPQSRSATWSFRTEPLIPSRNRPWSTMTHIKRSSGVSASL